MKEKKNMDHNQFKSKASYYFGQPTKERIQKWIEMLSSYSDDCQGNAHQKNELKDVAKMFLRLTKDLIQSEDYTNDNITRQCLEQLRKTKIDEGLINLMLKDFLGLFDIEFPVSFSSNFHTLATPMRDFNTIEKESARVEAAVKFVENNLQPSSFQRELNSYNLPGNHDKDSDHNVDLVVDDENIVSVSTDLLYENKNLTPYMAALRIIHAQDWNDDNKTQKIYNDLQRTQRHDSDLLVLNCYCLNK